MKRAFSLIAIIAVLSVTGFLMFHTTPTPTYGGGVGGNGGNTSTTLPSTSTPSTTPTTVFSSGPQGPNGVTVKGSVDYVAAQWVTNFYSEFYKWPNILYGPNVLARPFETAAFAQYGDTHNGNTTSIGSKDAWTLLTVDKTGTYPYITSVNVPIGVGTCELHCAVDVAWTNGAFNGQGVKLAPPANGPTSSATVLLTKVNGHWLVSAPPTSVAN